MFYNPKDQNSLSELKVMDLRRETEVQTSILPTPPTSITLPPTRHVNENKYKNDWTVSHPPPLRTKDCNPVTTYRTGSFTLCSRDTHSDIGTFTKIGYNESSNVGQDYFSWVGRLKRLRTYNQNPTCKTV